MATRQDWKAAHEAVTAKLATVRTRTGIAPGWQPDPNLVADIPTALVTTPRPLKKLGTR